MFERESDTDPWDIVCDTCGTHEETGDFDQDAALDYAEAIGWYAGRTTMFCPGCRS